MLACILSIFASLLLLFVCWIIFAKKEKGIYKLLYYTAAISWIVLIIIYSLDRYDIPSEMGWVDNINTQNWIMFLGTYLPSIISAVVGALFLIAVTVIQIEENRKDNEKRDLENLRIQNMPILKYSFNSQNLSAGELENLIVSNIDAGRPYNFNIFFKNVGANTIKDIKIDFEADFVNSPTRIFGKNGIEVVEKGEEKEILKVFSLKQQDKPYNIILRVFYEDVMTNWYKQEIKIQYIATNQIIPGGPVGEIIYEVKEAEIIGNKKI